MSGTAEQETGITMHINGHREEKDFRSEKCNTTSFGQPKAMHEESEGLDCLRKKLPRVSQAKIKGGIFFGPQVKQLFEDPT